jgi:glycosyltransferase involved in cell wall biosynthesis
VHIGLNLVFLVPGEQGGMEIYARELIPRLVQAAPEHRFTAFISREAAEAGGPWREHVGSVIVPVRSRSRVEWVRGEQQLLPPAAQRLGVELMHSLASTAPAWGPFIRVTTIHDLNYLTVPDAHPGIRALGMRVLVPLAARRSRRIIVDAHSTARDLQRHLHVAPDRIDVVALGVGHSRRGEPLPEDELRVRLQAGDRSILLTVSAKLANKNLMRLLRALARLDAATRPLLVLPGYHTPHEDELRAEAQRLGIEDDVRFLGWISLQELEGLYACCAAFVFPSLAEGFGLPVLEAMARGVPVACSGRGSLAEVAGDAALLFDPESEAAIAAAVSRLLRDGELRARLRAAGREQAAKFTWEQTARGTLDAYARAAIGAR